MMSCLYKHCIRVSGTSGVTSGVTSGFTTRGGRLRFRARKSRRFCCSNVGSRDKDFRDRVYTSLHSEWCL
jgi:hypothetical protein